MKYENLTPLPHTHTYIHIYTHIYYYSKYLTLHGPLHLQGALAHIILSVNTPESYPGHLTLSLISTIASRSLMLLGFSICKTTNICCSFIDHTM